MSIDFKRPMERVGSSVSASPSIVPTEPRDPDTIVAGSAQPNAPVDEKAGALIKAPWKHTLVATAVVIVGFPFFVAAMSVVYVAGQFFRLGRLLFDSSSNPHVTKN